MDFDKKGRRLSPEQLAAIYAKAKSLGISSKQLDTLKSVTSLNDEIVSQRRANKSTSIDAITPALKKQIAEGKLIAKPKKIKDIVATTAETNGITEEEAKRELAASGVIPVGISDEAVIGASKEEQFNEIKKKIEQKRFEKASRELVEEGIKKERKGTVAEEKQLQKQKEENLEELIEEKQRKIESPKPTVNKKQLEALREKLKKAQSIKKVQDKINKEQERLIKNREQQIKIDQAKLKKLRSANVPTQNIHGIGDPEVKGRTLGVDPFAIDVKEAKDPQFQLQKKEFELRQLGFSPGLAHERAKAILAQT